MNIPATCGSCHGDILPLYAASIHGRAAMAGKREAPVCTDCHGEHTILASSDPRAAVYRTSVSEKVCGSCHAAERIVSKYHLPADRLETYMRSYHGLASKFGATTVANCASCHGAHDILPSSDPRSSVHKNNLAKTCGQCHPGAGPQLAKGAVHVAPSPERNRAVYYVTVFYTVFIFLAAGGMALHNLLDFARKLGENYRRRGRARYVRFSLAERIQHLLLALTFITLAYTGFALKYAESWWAFPFTLFHVGHDWRGRLHGAAAVLFCALAVYHVLYLIFTKRGRAEREALAIQKKDFGDCWRMIRYYLGRTAAKPVFERYSYVEKFEYWALVWGSAVMVLTGALLTFENFTMAYFPKWVLDVALAIHFYEAVLATLAIVLWHFYFTIFDPDQYPLNWSMITGRTTEDRGSAEP
jgi:formate dehydrogenase gamma subunit